MRKIIKAILPDRMKQFIIEILNKRHNKKVAKEFYNKNRYTYTLSPDKMRPDTKVGQFTSIASNAWIAPGNHPLDMLTTSPFYYAPYNERKPEYNKRLSKIVMNRNWGEKTKIGNDVWIGVNATVLQGVKIADGVVVGANSLVTKDVPPYAIVGGVPAKIIRYRFSKEQISQLLKLQWWELPMEEINSLPFDDIDACIEKVQMIREKKRTTRILFLVTSVIEIDEKAVLNYSATRSIYSVNERNEQTIKTIKSIRDNVPNAEIWLIEGGRRSFDGDVIYGCDRYLYVGGGKEVRAAVDSKYKGVGEVRMLLSALADPGIKKFPFILKISGRYYLDDEFKIDDFDFKRFNFKNYRLGEVNHYVGESSYRKGSHSTRLYGVPGEMVDEWCGALRRSIWEMKFFHRGIENVMAKHIKGDVFFYRDILHIEGNIAVDGNFIKE